MKETQPTPRLPAGGLGKKPKQGNWEITGICTVLVILVFLVFGQTLRFDFVNYDDNKFVTENRHVQRGLTWENVVWSLTAGIGKNSVDIDFWRPLSLMSHMLDVQLFGLNAGAHHAMSVGIHVLTTVALFLVLSSMTGILWRSAFVAAVFAIHPLHVESVAWVAERKDVLSALFFVLTLGGYVRYARRPFGFGNYLLVVGMFALGLMSKPMVVTLPCVLLLLDYWPLKRNAECGMRSAANPSFGGRNAEWWQLVVEKLPLLAMSAAVAVLTTKGPGGSNDVMMTSLPLSWRVANAVVAYGTYLWQTVWPAGLACLYPHHGKNLSLWSVALVLVVLVAITAGVARQRKRRYLAMGWLWYVGMLVPVIGILQSGMQARADRYTYLPMIGVSLMVTWAVGDWAGQWRHRRMALGCVGVVVLCVLLVGAYHQTSYWRDSLSLWTHTLECTKDNPLAHNNLGSALLRQGRMEEALAHFRAALRIDPHYADAHNNLGGVMVQQGRTQEAIVQFRESLRLDPADPQAYYNLGLAMLRLGQTEEAIAQFREALALNPAYVDAHNNLGLAMFRLGHTEEAIGQFREALAIDPVYADAHNNLGYGMLQQGRREEAIAQFRAALATNPAYADAHNNLGNALLQQGQAQEAIEHMQKALELEPAKLTFQNDLAWVLATAAQPSLRNGTRALQVATQANQSSGGNNPVILRTLAAAYAAAGEFSKAAQTAQEALQVAQARPSNAALADALRREIRLYEAGEPFRAGQ